MLQVSTMLAVNRNIAVDPEKLKTKESSMPPCKINTLQRRRVRKKENKGITKPEENNGQKGYSKPKPINNYSKYKWNQFSNQKTVT